MILSNGCVYNGTGVKVPVVKTIGKNETKFKSTCSSVHCSKFKFRIDLKRIPNIYSAVAIFCDYDLKSFAALQEGGRRYFIVPHMGAEEITYKNLLLEASGIESNDIKFLINNETFPAHKFIVFSRAKGLMEIVQQFNDTYIYFNYKNLTGKIFEFILKHIYTNYFFSEEDSDDIQQPFAPETYADRREILTIVGNLAVQFGLPELANSLNDSPSQTLDSITAKQKSRFPMRN